MCHFNGRAQAVQHSLSTAAACNRPFSRRTYHEIIYENIIYGKNNISNWHLHWFDPCGNNVVIISLRLPINGLAFGLLVDRAAQLTFRGSVINIAFTPIRHHNDIDGAWFVLTALCGHVLSDRDHLYMPNIVAYLCMPCMVGLNCKRKRDFLQRD